MMSLWEVAGELSRRMTSIFLQDKNGRRPVFGNLEKSQTDPHWRDERYSQRSRERAGEGVVERKKIRTAAVTNAAD
jgi:hypothetical protein